MSESDAAENVARIQRLYESDNYLVVNKPFDMYINSEDPEEKNTLISYVALPDSHHRNSTLHLSFTHRLDYATSGAICLAHNKMAAAAAGRCFEKRTANKYYVAVVRGSLQTERADIKYYVGADTSPSDVPNRMRAVVTDEDVSVCSVARAAHTRLLVLQRGLYDGSPVTVVLLKPYTGRRHQLRVHLAALSHPILGDMTYNRSDVEPHRMFLHAIRLMLPIKNEPIDVETEEPFFTDTRFSCLWSSTQIIHSFATNEERLQAYETMDSEHYSERNYKNYFKHDSDG